MEEVVDVEDPMPVHVNFLEIFRRASMSIKNLREI